jgi:hypothetical protein
LHCTDDAWNSATHSGGFLLKKPLFATWVVLVIW